MNKVLLIIIIIIIIIPVRDAIVFPRGRTKVILIRYLWTRMLSKTENNSPFSKFPPDTSRQA